MSKTQIIADNPYPINISGKNLMIVLNMLSELPYHIAKPIIEDIENQVKQLEEKKPE